MSKTKINKYIDLNQFPRDKNGNISWKDSVGMTIDFYYYNKKHTIKIMKYISLDYVEIKVDDMSSEIVGTQKIRHLNFDNLFYEPNYNYNIGDIVNNIMILEQLFIKTEYKNQYGRRKHYKCRCLKDGYEYIISEADFKKSKGCPVCAGKRVFVGYNDLATTNPEIIQYLLNKEDGHKYTRCSHKSIWVVCPDCGHKRMMRVEDIVLNGFSCKKCSDGLSYPNKFAHNVFEQIANQYEEYYSEYSPDWAGRMRYDNYIKLLDGQEIIVEMDGGFHYNNFGKRSAQNDKIKDFLAYEHGITVIRINCFYNKIIDRFNFIKNNFINSLKQYFDLSNVNWNSANEFGISNRFIKIVNYYNEHPLMTIEEITNRFNLSYETIRNYLIIGGKLGLCKYVKNDLINRSKKSMPLILNDENGNYIGIYMSAQQMANEFTNEKFVGGSINACAKSGKPYKGYIIKRITWDEYESLQAMLNDNGGVL